MKTPSFSIVIATDGRAASLAELLDALRGLEGPAFEVCVVSGPTADHTDRRLSVWTGLIKTRRNPLRNVSVSRNLGVAMAAGDIVAFIDDDAVPETGWLDQLAEAFEDARVACAGGRVMDHTGRKPQYGYACCSRMGRARTDIEAPWNDCAPGADPFPYAQGTNMAVRRADFLEIGGFDEEFDFYLEETDLCARLVDAGRGVALLPGARVYHRFLPSPIRNALRVTHTLYSVLKNKLYFSLMHAANHHGPADALADFDRFAAEQMQSLQDAVTAGFAEAEALPRCRADVARARRVGAARGRSGNRRRMCADLASRLQRPFLPFPRRRPGAYVSCRIYPPAPPVASSSKKRDRTAAAAAVRDARAVTQRIWASFLPPGTRCALTLYPDHWNVGDAAIWWATRQVLRDLDVRISYACDPWSYDPEALNRDLPEGPLLLLGGGNFGDLYEAEVRLRERILHDFPRRPILQLPQSFWFRDPGALRHMADRLRQAQAVTLMARDADGLAMVRKHFAVVSVLCPDAALGLRLPRVRATPDIPVLALWRRDPEATAPLPELPRGWMACDWNPTDGIGAGPAGIAARFRHWVGDPPDAGQTCPARRLWAWRRTPWLWDMLARERVLQGVRLLARARLVITNRLHAHLLCLHMRKPHVVCDTVNGKIGAYRDTWDIAGPDMAWAETPAEAVEQAQAWLAHSGTKGGNDAQGA